MKTNNLVKKRVRFLNLSIQDKNQRNKYLKIFEKFLKEGVFMMGSEVEKFENNISQYLNKKYCVGVSSGTNAIYLSLKALGIDKNDEVIVPCMSWYSTFSVIKKCNANPVPCDIDNDLVIDFEDFKSKVTKNTKAVIIVHFTGLLKNYTNFFKFCKSRGIKIIEDCAQSFGTKINNKIVGSFSDISAFSMNPMKVYGALGEAGCVCTNNYKYYKKLKTLRYAGVDMKRDECIFPDLNHKIDTLQASMLNFKLGSFKSIHQKRIRNASLYEKYLTDKVIKPIFLKDMSHLYYTYTIQSSKRDYLKRYLESKLIETRIQHSKLIQDHYGFRELKKFKCHNGNILKNKVLSLPVHENLKRDEILTVIFHVNKFFS